MLRCFQFFRRRRFRFYKTILQLINSNLILKILFSTYFANFSKFNSKFLNRFVKSKNTGERPRDLLLESNPEHPVTHLDKAHVPRDNYLFVPSRWNNWNADARLDYILLFKPRSSISSWRKFSKSSFRFGHRFRVANVDIIFVVFNRNSFQSPTFWSKIIKCVVRNSEIFILGPSQSLVETEAGLDNVYDFDAAVSAQVRNFKAVNKIYIFSLWWLSVLLFKNLRVTDQIKFIFFSNVQLHEVEKMLHEPTDHYRGTQLSDHYGVSASVPRLYENAGVGGAGGPVNAAREGGLNL